MTPPPLLDTKMFRLPDRFRLVALMVNWPHQTITLNFGHFRQAFGLRPQSLESFAVGLCYGTFPIHIDHSGSCFSRHAASPKEVVG